MILEICVDSMESVVNAEKGGADRLELCAALSEGGLTPGLAFAEKVIHDSTIPVNVMIRPRNGDFCYTDDEFRIMLEDVKLFKKAGANGIVFGMLKPDGKIDKIRCASIINAARPMSVTFHRAFDMARDTLDSLDDLVDLGVDRILTSGCKPTAWDGRFLIKELVNRSAGRIIIMAGSGVDVNNIQSLIEETGVAECHASARSEIKSPMSYQNNGLAMGSGSGNEYRRMVTDTGKVKKLKIEARKHSHGQ